MDNNKKIDLVFPCAGKAERFGGVFKPFLKIGDLTFIEKAYEPFSKWIDNINKIHFIITQEQEKKFKVYENLCKMIPREKINVKFLKEETSGPLQTFVSGFDNQGERGFVVCDCDHSIDVDALFEQINSNEDKDIVIPTWNIDERIQKNWSKILIRDGKIEKFVNKEDVDFRKYDVKGIIGCIYFKNISLFENVSFLYSNFYELISDHFKAGKSIELINTKRAYFFGDPDMLADCIEKRRSECSIFCDIDGVLFEHKDHSSNDVRENNCLEGFRKLKFWASQGHKIILTTARNKKFKEQLETLLDQKGVHYDELVMSLPSGPRFIINDRKPSKPFTKQANSFEVTRNAGLVNFSISDTLQSNNIKVLQDVSANSFAKTYLIKNGNKTFVRKSVSKESDKHYQILKRQMNDLKRFNFLSPGICPKVLSEDDSNYEYYYDMEYLEGYNNLSEFNRSTQQRMLNDLLKIMNEKIYTMSSQTDSQKWIFDFISEKIHPKFNTFSKMCKEFDCLINSDVVFINEKRFKGLRAVFNELEYGNLAPTTIGVIHGDLTFENVLYSDEKNDFKLIDMDGSRTFDARELDLGKLSQSILANYSQWNKSDDLVKTIDVENKSFKCDNRFFDYERDPLVTTLFNIWQDILDTDNSVVVKKSFFYMSTYFIRFVPFRMQLGKNAGIFALLMATVWLNKTLEYNNVK